MSTWYSLLTLFGRSLWARATDNMLLELSIDVYISYSSHIVLCCKTHTYMHFAYRVIKDCCKTCISFRFPLYLLEELERVAWVNTMVNFHLILSATKRQFYTEVVLGMHLKGTHRIHPGIWHFWRLLSRAVSLTFSVLYFTGHSLQMVLCPWLSGILCPFGLNISSSIYLRFMCVIETIYIS